MDNDVVEKEGKLRARGTEVILLLSGVVEFDIKNCGNITMIVNLFYLD